MPNIYYTQAEVERIKEELRNLYAILWELENDNDDGQNDRLICEVKIKIDGLQYELSGIN